MSIKTKENTPMHIKIKPKVYDTAVRGGKKAHYTHRNKYKTHRQVENFHTLSKKNMIEFLLI
jgi:hypothetical protein